MSKISFRKLKELVKNVRNRVPPVLPISRNLTKKATMPSDDGGGYPQLAPVDSIDFNQWVFPWGGEGPLSGVQGIILGCALMYSSHAIENH